MALSEMLTIRSIVMPTPNLFQYTFDQYATGVGCTLSQLCATHKQHANEHRNVELKSNKDNTESIPEETQEIRALTHDRKMQTLGRGRNVRTLCAPHCAQAGDET